MDQQKVWDELLIQGWRNEYKIWWVIFRFFEALSAPHKEGDHVLQKLKEIKRAPRNVQQLRKPTRAFVHDGLPPLSRILWDTKTTDENVLILLARSKLDTYQGRTPRSVKTARIPVLQRNRFFDISAGHRRSDWGTVKPTKSR